MKERFNSVKFTMEIHCADDNALEATRIKAYLNGNYFYFWRALYRRAGLDGFHWLGKNLQGDIKKYTERDISDFIHYLYVNNWKIEREDNTLIFEKKVILDDEL